MSEDEWVEFDPKWKERETIRVTMRATKTKFIWDRRAITATRKALAKLSEATERKVG